MSLCRAPAWCLAVLGVCLFAAAPAAAQTVEHNDSDTLQPGSAAPPATASAPDLSRAGELIVTYTNQFRAGNGRGELKVNARLGRAAQGFAEYMARTDTFSHSADGKHPSQRMTEQGYQFCVAAENIAWEYNSAGFTTTALARELVRGWRHSPEHRRNMLDPDLDEIGVGVARSDRTGRFYAVQDFGRPRSRAVVFRITNDADAPMHYTLDGKHFSLQPHYTITHQRCRASELEFREAHGDGASSGEREETFHPKSGARFVIRGDRAGGYTVAEQEGSGGG
jgi:uncharacterized protein YkwD